MKTKSSSLGSEKRLSKRSTLEDFLRDPKWGTSHHSSRWQCEKCGRAWRRKPWDPSRKRKTTECPVCKKPLVRIRGHRNKVSLARHLRGDWGDLCPEDWDANERALQYGGRLFSAYQEEGLPKIWIITEADRSATTILFPEEY